MKYKDIGNIKIIVLKNSKNVLLFDLASNSNTSNAYKPIHIVKNKT